MIILLECSRQMTETESVLEFVFDRIRLDNAHHCHFASKETDTSDNYLIQIEPGPSSRFI